MAYRHLFFRGRSNAHRCIIAGLASFLILGSSATLAQSASGTITVEGTIAGSTCSLTTDNIRLDVGAVDRSRLSNVGDVSDWSNQQSFVWGACDATLITLRFDGLPDANNPALFATTSGTAKGVGIQLRHATLGLEIYKPNDTTSLSNPAANNQTWTFEARYMRTAVPLVSGDGNATITVAITYT